MTIASEITQSQTNLANSYTACQNKGATMPASQNFDNLATAISSIPSSGGSFIGIPREIKNGIYQMPTESFTFSLPSDVTNVGNYGLYGAFRSCSGLTNVDLSSLAYLSGNALSYAFENCRSLISVDLSSLTDISGNGLSYAFYGCSALTSIDLSSLTTMGASGLSNAFRSCSGLTNVDLSSLTTVGNSGLGYAFQACTNIAHIYFRALTTSSFGSYTNQFNGMMQNTGTSTTHTLHFPSNIESTISGLSGYPLFNGTSGYVVLAFDLPATYTLTGANATTYSRNPKHDTSTALAWKVGTYGTTDFEPAYYTSGLTNPQANDTIYSDSACTTSVTTISSIS